MPATIEDSASCWRMRMTSFVYGGSIICHNAALLFSWSHLLQDFVDLRLSTSLRLKKIWQRGDKVSRFFLLSSPKCVFFSILAGIHFATVRTKRDDYKTKLVIVSLNRKDLIHFPKFRSNMLHLCTTVRHFGQNRLRNFRRGIFQVVVDLIITSLERRRKRVSYSFGKRLIHFKLMYAHHLLLRHVFDY